MSETKNYLLAKKIATVEIEYTSKCNLKCTYCPIGKPDYHGSHMGDDVKQFVYRLLDSGHVDGIVALNSVGETTFAPGWVEYSKNVRRAENVKTYIFTNLARTDYSEEEFIELSLINRVHFTLDTIDNNVLQSIRRKVNAHTIGHNVSMIQAAALKHQKGKPELVCNAMMNNESIFGVEDLVYWCVTHNIPELHLFSLYESVREDRVDNVVNVERLENLPEGDRDRAKSVLDRAVKAAKQHGIRYWMDPGVEHFFKGTKFESHDVKPGYTRNCHQPWVDLIIKHDGNVALCCVQHSTIIGNVRDAHDPLDFFNTIMQDVREGLFTGNLSPQCQSCQFKDVIPVEEFQAAIRHGYDYDAAVREP